MLQNSLWALIAIRKLVLKVARCNYLFINSFSSSTDEEKVKTLLTM